MDGIFAIFLFLVCISVLIGLWVMDMYNGLVPMREKCREAKSNIDTHLARRLDLYVKATSVLENGSEFEKSVFVKVAELRSRVDLSAAEKITEIGKLIAVAESNPDVKSVGLFSKMQDLVAGTESLIQKFRQEYNAAAKEYNAALLEFPNNLVVGILGFVPVSYFELTV